MGKHTAKSSSLTLIANYCHQLHCKWIWMPLMFHSLDVLCVNAYLGHFRLQTDMRDWFQQKVYSVIGGDNASKSHCHGLHAAQICP